MKYPAVLPFSELLLQLGNFDAIIDVRSPSEFAEDHLPGAINCPVLDDAQRVQIGTMYKQVNAFEAKKAGAVLVARNIAQHVEALFIDQPRTWQPLIYCWRGGNRSAAMAHIFAKIGWPVLLLEGGYKAYRRHVLDALPAIVAPLQFEVICGPTGSGKSRLLQTLAAQGAQVLDLEQLAAHRGSVLGFLPAQPQPSQKAFESAIWDLLRGFDPAQVVFVESESKKVGNLRVPDALMDKIRAARCIALTMSRADRVRLLLEDYQHFAVDPGLLNLQLDCLTALHGKAQIGQWQQLAMSGQMAQVVDALLLKHYDPAYLQSIQRNFALLPSARRLEMNDISEAALLAAAAQLYTPVDENNDV